MTPQSSPSSPSSTTVISALRVVPPAELSTAKPLLPRVEAKSTSTFPTIATAPQPAAEIDEESTSKRGYQRWVMLGVIATGLSAISLIPIPYQVGGTVQLDWRETARQSVHTPIPAIVTDVLVATGEAVHPGQVVAQLSSRELERDIAEVEEKLTRARQELATAQQEQMRAQATLIESRALQSAAQERAERLQQRVVQLRQGNSPPEVQTLQIEYRRLQAQLQEAAIQVDRHEELYAQGAISRSSLETHQASYRNLERDLATKAEQIELAQQQLVDNARDEIAAATHQDAAVQAASMVAAVSARMEGHQETIATLEKRLQQLADLKSQLTIRVATSGTVISSDLDLFVGQQLQPETPLMRIADLAQLTANVEVREEDLDYVAIDAPVTFRPRQAKLDSYNARVEDVLYNVQPDATQQQRVATVRVVIDNSDGRLRPGSSGYARISSEWIPLYKRLGRELLKLVPERFL